MRLLRRATAFAMSALMAFGHPAEVLAASYIFRQPSAAGTYPIPTITNNIVTVPTYYKVDGRMYSMSWQGTGGRSPYVIELVAGSLPPGCTAPVQTGSILTTSCSFTAEGSYSGIIAQLTDANGMVVRDNAPTITVSAPAPTLGTYNFPFTGYVATPYTGSLKITGGRQNFTVSRATGTLPPGLALSQTQDLTTGQWSVVLSGNPTTVGSYTFDILVTDANQKQATSSTINVSVGYGPVSLPLRPSKTAGTFNLVAGQPASGAGVNIVGGTPPVSLSLISGAIPPGMSLSPDGQLSGTPTRPGTYSGIQIRAVDSAANQRTATSALITLNVATAMSAIVMGANDVYVRNRAISAVSTSASGGTAPYSYNLTGTLPPGLSFSKTSGQISGTPTVAGRYDGLFVTVTDANGFTTDTAPFTMAVADPLTISGTPPKGVAGSDYAFSFMSSGGTQPYSYSLVQGDLPFGLDLSGDGKLTGTPFLSGTYPGLVVRLTDADGSTKDTPAFTLVIADELAVSGAPNRAATRGLAYNSAFTAAGGTAPYNFSLVSGSLPPGLSMASSGGLTGSPTTAGTYTFTARLADAEGRTATGDGTIVVSSPVVLAGTPGPGTVGQAYSATFTASGGTAPYLFDIGSGIMPDGLAMDPTGRISGTPATAGTYPNIVVRVADADGRTAQQTISIVVAAPLAIAGNPSSSATRGQAYSAAFSATGGSTPYSFAMASGTLPSGLTLNASSGAIAGSPAAAGTTSGLTVRVTDAAGRTATSNAFQIVVQDPLAVTGSGSTTAAIGQPYNAQFTASGGVVPYGWTLASGSLPPGLTLDPSTGLVSGSPTTAGSYPNLQLRASDADGRTAVSSIWGISVVSNLAIAGTPPSVSTVGQPYNAQFTASGGVGAKTFSLASGALPTGLSLDPSTGAIGGTPATRGTAGNLSVRVRDESGSAATSPLFQIVVSDDLTVIGSPTPDASVGSSYTGYFTATGGRIPYAWNLSAGVLPAGLTLNVSTGVIGGTPTAAGTASGLRLRVVDADGRSVTTDEFSINVTGALAVAGAPTAGTVGQAYSAQYVATGGLGPYSYGIVAGPLPAGLSINPSTGLIGGTPASVGTSGQMQVQVVDAKGRSAVSAIFSIVVRDPLRLVPTNIGPGTVGQSYSASMTPAGGRAPYTLSVSSGALPPGLTLNASSGAIGGTPTTAGAYDAIVIRGVDADGRTAMSDPFSIAIAAGVQIAGTPPQPATVGLPYAFSFTASGGQTPYSWSVAGGALPAGLGIDPSSGALGGTPTTAGAVSGLTAVVNDRDRRQASSQPFTIDVRDPVTVSGTPASVASTGQSYSAPFAAAGGRGPFVFSMIGTLPAGLTLSPTSGTVSGTPTTVGDVSGLRVRATDADGRVGASSAFAISVVSPLALAGTPAAYGDVGTVYTASFTASGGKSPYAFSVAAGTLPAGLTLDGATGAISGTPTAVGTAAGLQVRVTDANSTTALSQTFSIAIANPLTAAAEVGPGTVAATYSGRVAATGGRGPFTYALTAGTLPAGLSLSTTSGQITGTPSAAGTSSGLQVRATDADGRTASTAAFSITVDARLAFTGLGVPTQFGTVGTTYDSGVSAAGGRTPYVYAMGTGTLPAGLVLDAATGRITGTPTAAGAAEGLTIAVADADARSASSAVFRIDVRDPVTVAGAAPSYATVGTTYGPAAFTASGGRGPYTYAAVGTLPPGLTVNAAGSLSGTPSVAGNFAGIQVRATDQDGRTGVSTAFGIEVSRTLAITGVPVGIATVGTGYSADFTATDGRGPYVFSIAAGVLPAGLTLNASTGSIGGTPTATGSYPSIQIRVTDADARTATTTAFGIVVSDVLSASAAPSSAVRAKPYTTSVAVAGGRGPFVFSLVAGTLPAGLTLGSGTGTISGTPSAEGVATGLQVRVVDADGRIAVTPAFSISVSTTMSLALAAGLAATKDVTFTAQATVSGGRGPYAYSVTVGTLPAGTTLDGATGQIAGTPTTVGQSPVTITVTDVDARTATASTTITVSDPLLLAAATDLVGTVGQNFARTFAATGGRTAYTYAVTGTLPAGLSLTASSGILSGTPTAAGTATGLRLVVTDADGRTVTSNPFSIDIRAAMAFTAVPNGIATLGTTYGSGATVSGGRGPFSFSLAAGTLPAGLALDAATGQVAGTPTAIGTASGLQLTATDADNRTVTSPAFAIDVRSTVTVAGAPPAAATTGAAYGPVTFVASGGRGTFTYAVVGVLPAGLSLSTMGVLSGTPSVGGTFADLQVRATDQDGRTGLSSTFTITVKAGLSVSAALPASAITGTAYTGTTTASGGSAPYAFALAGNPLPTGLTLDTATGAIGGTPTATGSFAGIQIRATDADSRTATSAAATIVVSNPLTASADPAPAVRSTAYSTTVVATGGRTAYGYALVAGTLPAGLSLNASTGVIGGTPTTTQVASGLQVRVVDADGRSAVTPAFTISVAPALSLAVDPLLAATRGTAFTAQATASGGRTAYVYSVSTGTLPAGLTLNASTGAISGTPTAVARNAITLRAVDADGRTATAATTISVTNPMALAATNADAVATVGQPYSRGIAVVGGQSPYAFALASGTLPPGLTLGATTGTISGTPTTEGIYGNIAIRVTDADGRVATTDPVAIDVRANPTFVGVPSPVATVGTAYSSGSSASGGNMPYVYSLATGTLPAGLSLSTTTGLISGTPTAAGTASGLQIRAVDQDGRTALSAPFPIDVRAAMAVAGTPSPAGTAGVAYPNAQFSASGGRSPYTYGMVGTLPAGLALSTAGLLSGTPTAAGNTTGLQVRATDADGRTAVSSAFSIQVAGQLSISGSAPGFGTVGTVYSGSYAAQNGRAPYAFSVAAGTLPAGLTLNASTGAIGGTPSAAGSSPGIQIRATDADGRTATAAAVTILISNPMTASVTAPLATRSVAYSTTVAVAGGRSGYAFNLVAGTLPAGLTLGAGTGTISGTPTTTQVASGLQVRVVDADGRITTTQSFEISVAPALSLALSNPIQATVGIPLSATATASGGRPAYAFGLTSGTLPAGVALNASSGAISGTPTTAGSSAINVTVTDFDGRTAMASSTLVVANPVTVSPPTETNGTVGATFSSSFTTGGGSGSYTFAVVAGSLPGGLSINAATGAITGTPSSGGSFPGIQVRATDAAGRQGVSPSFAISITPPLTMTLATSYAASSGANSSIVPNVSGGRQPLAWSVAGSVPPGMALNTATGAVEGVPSSTGNFFFTITAEDVDGRRASASTTVSVTAPLVVKAPSPIVDQNVRYSGSFTASGGTAPYTYKITSGTLPPGLTFSNGSVTGTATQMGDFVVVVEATDKAGVSTSITATFNAAFQITTNNLRPQDPDLVESPFVNSPVDQSGTFSHRNGFPARAFAGSFFGAQEQIVYGIPPYSVSVAPALPTGITARVDGNQLLVTGTHGSVEPDTTYTFTITDSVGRKMSETRHLPVDKAPAPGWYAGSGTSTPAFNSYSSNFYGDLKVANPSPNISRDFSMSKDGLVSILAGPGKTYGDGIVSVYVDTAQWVEPFNNGYVRTQVLQSPDDAPGFGKKAQLSDDGNWLIVSAPNDTKSSSPQAVIGSVYVYRRAGNTFEYVWKTSLRGSPGAANVAISNGGTVISYTYNDLQAAPTYYQAGSRVAIARWNGSTYATESTLTCAVATQTCGVGAALKFAASADTLGVGNDGNFGVYKFAGGTWTKTFTSPTEKNVDNSNRTVGESFAFNIDGTKVLAAATLYQGGFPQGWSVYAYSLNVGGWTKTGSISALYTSSDNDVGTSLRSPLHISASDDLSTHVVTSNHLYAPEVHIWSGVGTSYTGARLMGPYGSGVSTQGKNMYFSACYNSEKAFMSADGNTVHGSAGCAFKKSWPASR